MYSNRRNVAEKYKMQFDRKKLLHALQHNVQYKLQL